MCPAALPQDALQEMRGAQGMCTVVRPEGPDGEEPWHLHFLCVFVENFPRRSGVGRKGGAMCYTLGSFQHVN